MSIEVGSVFGVSIVWREKGEKWHSDCVGTKKKKRQLGDVLGSNWMGLERPFFYLAG